MNSTHTSSRAGVTLTELLVVLVIVSILSAIAVPVYMNKAENARKTAALSECRQLAEAEDACVVHHGFYVPLQLLDDLPKGASQRTTIDTIDKETSVKLIDPNKSIFTLDQNQPSVNNVTSNPRIADTVNNWQGPFLNVQRVFTGATTANNPSLPTGSEIMLDYPLDPWGNPYRFYSPLGVIGSTAYSGRSASDWSNTSFSDGQVTRTDPNRFDRYAVVSYGPDGLPDTASGNTNNDDIYYIFGTAKAPLPTETVLP